MTARTPTRELPRPAHEPAEQQLPRSRWPAVAASAVGMLVIVVIAAVVWFLVRGEPLDVGPAPRDDAAEEPEQPEAPAEEPGDDAQVPEQPDEPGPEVVYGTESRANWDVTGVSADDRLNVRTGPGVHNAVTATLASDTVELESTGRIAEVDGALWREIVEPGDGAGWVNARYLAETSPALLDDGRHAAYLQGIDVAASTVTVDVIQFLTGQEAVDAYRAEFPDDPSGPPNDYWIVNANQRLRTMSVSADVSVRLVRLAEDGDADLDAGTWEELPEYLAGSQAPGDGRLSWNPFWLEVRDGLVTGIVEQYTP